MNVLISLYKGYGLGDAVQMSAVLRHIRAYRSDWKIDFQAEKGRETVGYGIVNNIFAYGEPYPSEHYDLDVQIVLYDTRANWLDRPDTRVTSCLHERFGIEWDKRYGRYLINVPLEIQAKVPDLSNYICIHYQGDSDKERKDISITVIKLVTKNMRDTPLILDWRPDSNSIIRGIRSFGFDSELGRDAQWNCAIISKCKAFIGIDSGPGKCASATNTPSLIIWTHHDPAAFHDPAPNTTHLVPASYISSKFFQENYKYAHYTDLVQGILKWIDSLP